MRTVISCVDRLERGTSNLAEEAPSQEVTLPGQSARMIRRETILLDVFHDLPTHVVSPLWAWQQDDRVDVGFDDHTLHPLTW